MSNFNAIVSFLPEAMVEHVLAEYDLNDPAHLRQHAIDVVCHADEIIKHYHGELEKYRKPIIIAALLHDIKCHVNRDLHHILGALAVDEILERFDIAVIKPADLFDLTSSPRNDGGYRRQTVESIKLAVLEHRASWKTERSGVISEVVAAADRGKPDMYKYIRRAVLFRTAHVDEASLPFTDEMKRSVIKESIDHMKEKYGVDGYVYKTLPTYTRRMYRKDLDRIVILLENESDKLVDFAMANFDKWVGVCRE